MFTAINGYLIILFLEIKTVAILLVKNSHSGWKKGISNQEPTTRYQPILKIHDANITKVKTADKMFILINFDILTPLNSFV